MCTYVGSRFSKICIDKYLVCKLRTCGIPKLGTQLHLYHSATYMYLFMENVFPRTNSSKSLIEISKVLRLRWWYLLYFRLLVDWASFLIIQGLKKNRPFLLWFNNWRLTVLKIWKVVKMKSVLSENFTTSPRKSKWGRGRRSIMINVQLVITTYSLTNYFHCL